LQKIYQKDKILKTILRIFLLLSLVPDLQAQSPKHEVRAVWLTTIGGIDWPHSYSQTQQKQELIRTLDQLQQANINTVLIQARVRATTIFPSDMEPWDGCLSGKPGTTPGYDALQMCIDECHKRGMECHAWIVTIPVGKWNTYGCKLLRQKMPNVIVKVGEEGYMNPEKKETGDYLAKFCREVTRKYDIDGIHLDYIRYPETWKLKVTRQQGRQYITDIVRKINIAVKSEKPWVKMSCSPIGKYDDLTRFRSNGWNANTTVCQDAQAWLRDGLMDALFPMMYFQGTNFYPFAVNWKEYSYGRIIAPGLAVYMLHPREKDWALDIITREMSVCREMNLGHTFFRSKFLTDNTKGIYSFTKDFNSVPALVPPMTWENKQAPTSPRELNLQRGMSTDRLSWQAAKDRSGCDYITYNIYASQDYPVDWSKAENIIAQRVRKLSVNVPHGGQSLNYAVTAVDRYGNESTPLFSIAASQRARKIDFRELIIGRNNKKRH
jgi:uncharacterized lipoprotein YddW (UPF0748 family)